MTTGRTRQRRAACPSSSRTAGGSPRQKHPMNFRDLRYTDMPLLLPNAWDVVSAVAFTDAGFPAVVTTSSDIGPPGAH